MGNSESAAPVFETSRTVSAAELAKHNRKDDCWVAIHGFVFDVNKFAPSHRADYLIDKAGQDATKDFKDVGHSKDAETTMKKLLVGKLA